jgi:hypothetical protein
VGKALLFGLQTRFRTGAKSMYILRGKLLNTRSQKRVHLAKMANERSFSNVAKTRLLNAFKTSAKINLNIMTCRDALMQFHTNVYWYQYACWGSPRTHYFLR